MRLAVFTIAILAAVLGACGGTPAAPGQPTQPAGQATTPPGQATTPPGQATPAPPPPVGGGTVSVTLTGGPTPGSYVGSANPNCSFGFLSPGTWGVSYVDDAAGSGITGVVLVSQPADSGGQGFSISVTIGTSALYSVLSAGGSPTPSIQVTDNGTTAVIHVSGGTLDGTGTVDVTVNCPSVIRQ